MGFAAGSSSEALTGAFDGLLGEQEQSSESSPQIDPSEISYEDRPRQGESNATVRIYYFSDYQCPFCHRFERTTLPRIESQLVESGEVELVRKSYAFMGQDSLTAELASKCVWRNADTETYWDWNKYVFNQQGDKDGGWASRSSLLNYTEKVEGVSSSNVSTCLDQNRSSLTMEVRNDMNDGRAFGISGTPGFVVYNTETGAYETLSGAQPFVRFSSVIESVR